MPNVKWELLEGIRLIRRLEAAAVEHKWNVHFALGGSVLMKGWSDKDLDILCYNHGGCNPIDRPATIALIEGLTKWTLRNARHEGTGPYEGQQVGDFVFKTTDSQGRAIDIFFVEKTLD